VSFVGGPNLAAMVGGHVSKSAVLTAVVPFGTCTAILVRSDLLLSSAHCTESPPSSVVIGGRSVQVDACERPPPYRIAHRVNDIAICRLHEPASVTPLALDDGPGLVVGDAVVLAGYGTTGPFEHDSGQVRVVETAVVRTTDDGIQVGTDRQTACRGDSGSPILVARVEGFRVAGVVRGTSGAICASPTDAISVQKERAWLADAGLARASAPSPRLCVAGSAIFAGMLIILIAWLSKRAPRSRG
jgi:hypothetical protein